MNIRTIIERRHGQVLAFVLLGAATPIAAQITIQPDGSISRQSPSVHNSGNPRDLTTAPTPADTDPAAFVDADIGLELEKGPLRQGIGPTSLVVEVAPGTMAAGAGILPGDIILMIDNGASEPLGHFQMIRQGLERGRIAEIVVERAGEWQTLSLAGTLPSQDRQAAAAEGFLDISTVKAGADQQTLDFIASRRFDRDRPALEQLTTLAAAFGIAETDISRALAAGAFVPPMEDLTAAYMELEGPGCRETVEEELRRRSEHSDSYGPGTGTWRSYLAEAKIHCGGIAIHNDKGRKTAWNERFGGIPDFVPDRDVEWRTTVLQLFDNNRVYPQARCNFTASLGGRLDCDQRYHGTLVPTAITSKVSEQTSAAARSDVFGPPHDHVAFRLRLIADGATEALHQIARKDARNLNSLVAQWFSINAEPDFYHAGLINQYAITRVSRIGACGDDVVRLENFVPLTLVTRRGGVTVSSEDRSYFERWEVPRQFAPVSDRLKNAMAEGFLVDQRRDRVVSGVFDRLSCNSPERLILEENMVAYLHGRDFPHRRQ